MDGQPYVIPTAYGRVGDDLYIHGSAASRMLRELSKGVDVCVTVTLVDGLVLARSAFHHSINYRSVVILGKATLVEAAGEKDRALEAITEHIIHGRWPEVRWPNELELKATSVLKLPINEASAKVRTGPPIDDEEDYEMTVWAGVVPLALTYGPPIADDRLAGRRCEFPTTSSTKTEMAKRNSSYGWVIVAVSTLALVVSNGLAIGGLPPFYKPIREEFVAIGAVDAARAESFIANAANITFLMSGVFSLLGGWLVTRFSLKPLMVIGCVLLGGGLIVHSQAATAETVYLSRFLMGASLGFIGVAPNVVLVSAWFTKKRGTALGIMLTGTSIGGVIIPLIAQPLIASTGWRTAMLWISALVWLVLLPVVLFAVKEKKPAKTAQDNADGMSLGEALLTPIFWALAACAALIFYPIFVTSQQFILYLQSPRIGLSAETAAFAQSALFAVSVGGKFLAGFFSDIFRSVRVLAACAFVMLVASFTLFGLSASNWAWFLLPFALGYGGTFVLIQRLTADLFGRREAGKILGLITLIEVIGAVIGGRITGHLADLHGGDYRTAFRAVIIACALAFAASLLVLILNRKRLSMDESL